MLLTLPGAALWSLPIGVLGIGWVRTWLPGFALPEWILMCGRPVIILLLPVSAVCSFLAMESYVESNTNHGTSALLMMFNLITGFLSLFGTIAAVIVWVSC